MERRCNKCGTELPGGSYVCPNCHQQDVQYKRTKEHDYLASAGLFLGLMGFVMIPFPLIPFLFGATGFYLGISRLDKRKALPAACINALVLVLALSYWGAIFLGYL